MNFKRLDKMARDAEKQMDILSQDMYKLSETPTVIRLDKIKKDVVDMRHTLTDIMSYINSMRIW